MNLKRIGITGHAGIGHVDGCGGFIQDDSGGFITVGLMIREILGANTGIKQVEADPNSNTIQVTTLDGGSSTSSPRRGITPKEAELINNLIGKDALFCQALTINTFGRMYGQGILETPVALQAALANSVVDTFHKKSPSTFRMTEESISSNCGLIGGLSTVFNKTLLSFLISVNYTKYGLGPVEDLEGNIPIGTKRIIMEELEIVRCPTIIVESKAYLPAISDKLKQNTFLIRAQRGIDNMTVAKALYDSAKELGYSVILRDDLLPFNAGFMRQNTINFAQKIIDQAEALKKSELASEKVSIIGTLSKLISQDAGGISCISNKLHDIVRGPGMVPGTSAVLSILVTTNYYRHWKIPLFDKKDAEMTKNIIDLAVERISENIDDAYDCLDNYYQSLDSLEHSIH